MVNLQNRNFFKLSQDMNLESSYMYIHVWFIYLGKKFVTSYKKLVYLSSMVS